MTPFWIEASGAQTLTCDIAIIGSGAGGSIAALSLAEAGFSVVLLEKGFFLGKGFIPKTLADAVAQTYEENGFRTTRGVSPMPVAGGTGLGGSTLVNSAICFRTPEDTLDRWNDLSKGAFSDRDAFYSVQDEIWKFLNIHETPDPLLSGNDIAHKKASQRLNWIEGNIHRNTPGCGGCGRCNAICSISGKNSLDRVALPRAYRAGAQIYTGAHVEHLDEHTVSGKLYSRERELVGQFTVKAQSIIVAAGSIGTPQLLLNSGFGSRNTQIGKGLHLHPVMNISAMLPKAAYKPGSTQGHFSDQFVNERVLLESNPVIAGVFFQSFPLYADTAKRMLNASQFVSTGGLVRDITEGTVLASKGRAHISYDISQADRAPILTAMRKGAQLWLEGADATEIALPIFGAPTCKNMKEVAQVVHDNLPLERVIGYSSHPQASCRIGRALDEKGKLRGSQSIYVMDASALPSNVGRNPQVSIMTTVRLLSQRFAQAKGKSIKPL